MRPICSLLSGQRSTSSAALLYDNSWCPHPLPTVESLYHDTHFALSLFSLSLCGSVEQEFPLTWLRISSQATGGNQKQLFQQTASLSSPFWLEFSYIVLGKLNLSGNSTQYLLFQWHQEKAQWDNHRLHLGPEIQTFPLKIRQHADLISSACQGHHIGNSAALAGRLTRCFQNLINKLIIILQKPILF